MATVLVVEDDRLSQRIMQKILSGAGHTALLTASVEEAWATLRQHVAVDLVILDNQLGRNWGWRFLEELRQDPLFRELPVVVYTGHTERSSILRYVELGVTSMLVKPYKAETIYDEVAKAVKTDWVGKLIEKPEAAFERLKVKESDYYSVLSAGASVLEKTLEDLRRAVAGKNGAPPAVDTLQQLYNQSVTLGMPALRATADQLAKALANRNTKVIESCLLSVETLRSLLRHRALAYLGIEEVGTKPSAAGRAKTSGAANAAATSPQDGAKSAAEIFQRKLASVSLANLGAALSRLGGQRLFAEAEWDAIAEEDAKRTPISNLLEAARYIDQTASSGSMEDLQSGIKEIPGFPKVFLEIAHRLAAKADSELNEADIEMAIHRLGMNKTVVLIAAAKLAPSLRLSSPLDLEPLRVHTVCAMLLAYEIARMLRLIDEPLAAAASTLDSLGNWVFAGREPALFAAASAIAAHTGRPPVEVEQDIFAITHYQAAQRIVGSSDLAVGLQELARYLATGDTSRADIRSTAAAVELANELAWTVYAQEERFLEAAQARLLSSDNPLWTSLADCGVELPMDLPEFVDVLLTAANTSKWIADTLLAQSGAAPTVSRPA